MKKDPTKDPEFKRVLGNLLKAPPKPHAEMKLKKRGEAEASRLPVKAGRSKSPRARTGKQRD
jgi:hypothetical protein